MARHNASPDLHSALTQRCERIRKARSTVPFRRGEPAFGMFIILRGTVRLDFGVDGAVAVASVCGPGALVGLPATLTKRHYSMTATVMTDAELGFLTSEALECLLREHPEFRQELRGVLAAKVARNDKVKKARLQ